MVSFLALVAICLAFNKYAYDIDQFNTQVRIFLRTGTIEERSFDANGLPISRNPRMDGPFISPFYVVHYGLIYSDTYKSDELAKKIEWEYDPSLKYWNVPPKTLKKEYFQSSANWIINHIEHVKGQAHLLYKFHWYYPKYPNGGLNPPWWSGLTDSYAIILMLRAYDVFHEQKYLDAATNLYNSVLKEISEGGSLSSLNGAPWIEEYVDPRIDASEMSKVWNGMVYAYKGVKAYEASVMPNHGVAQKLRDSIIKNTHLFVKNDWSYYDAIGNPNNIKYHLIHYSLAQDPDFDSPEIKAVISSWRVGANNPGFFWLLNGQMSPSKIHFIAIFLISIGAVIIFSMRSLKKNEADQI